MPTAVLGLVEQACEIVGRHVGLSSIQSELLLKMAWYISELEGLHNRCRWGTGLFNKDLYSESEYGIAWASSDDVSARYELTGLSKLDLGNLREKGILDAILSQSSVEQCRRFTKILHRAVCISGLGTVTRAFVAARCAKLCLKGVKVPEWSSDVSCEYYRRFTLPRKAAFFSVVAAEAMHHCVARDAERRASKFWEAAHTLYSKDGNGHDSNKSYGWATLRITILHALSQQKETDTAELALEQLLMLLAEITPDLKPSDKVEDVDLDVSKHFGDLDQTDSVLSDTHSSIVNEPISAVKRDSSRKGMTNRGTVFGQGQTISPAMISQSKWYENDLVSLLQLPLIESSTMLAMTKEDAISTEALINKYSLKTLPPLIALGSVISDMKFEVAAAAQNYCISILTRCRRDMAKSSIDANDQIKVRRRKIAPFYPLEITFAEILKSESHMLLDRIKAAGFSTKNNSSLATFFNPFANKKKDEPLGKNLVTVVAQGEERTIKIVLSNRLSIPLSIPSCQLEFKKSDDMEIEAPPLSFQIPSKYEGFIVYFPFIVIDTKQNLNGATKENRSSSAYKVEVTGLRFACFNKSIYIPFEKNDENIKDNNLYNERMSLKQIPDSISLYPRRHIKSASNQLSVKLETVPAQPNLLVSFSTSPTPLEDATMVPVHLAEGEIYTIPPFRLENDFGPSGLGRMERLQIVGVGLPGLPEEILFDTDELAKALEEKEENFTDTESESETDFEELMESDGLPPLKMKCLADGLSLKSINDTSKSLGEGSIVTFQIAATHDMGNKIKNGGNVRIRFRYRGPSSTPGIENWRKREIALQIVRVKGPRISSLTLRSDLSWGSAYTDLCMSLKHQKLELENLRGLDQSTILRMASSASGSEPTYDANGAYDNVEENSDSILHRVGRGNGGVFVSGDDIVVLMAVANETNSTIILSNRIGVVGGFESSPMPTVRVTSGVSVKIPVVIPRIDCLDSNGEIIDIAAELIARTALQWKSEVVETEDITKKRARQGRVRIPSRCLREIIDEHKSFAVRVCKPPLTVKINIGGNSESNLLLKPGHPLDVHVDAKVQDWVPPISLDTCMISLELCCARKDSGRNAFSFNEENEDSYIWCGQVRRVFRACDQNMKHSARIVFMNPGEFIVSACVKIYGKDNQNEEIWWAPRAKSVIIERCEENLTQ